jgi:hypothetical protein
MIPIKDAVDLSLVESVKEIRDNLIKFNQDAISYHHRTENLLKQTSYWIKDASQRLFGPTKFLGFQSMNFIDYEAATKGYERVKIFNGTITRTRIEKVLGLRYAENLLLSDELITWGETLLGEGIFESIKQSKWKFIVLP